MNEDKTKYMYTGQSRIVLPGKLIVRNFEFEQVKELKYLGFIITEDNISSEI